MRRTLRRRVFGAAAALLLALAPAAAADPVANVGPIDDTDLDSRTIVIGTRTLAIGPATEIRDDDGNPMTFREVDDLDLWWARYVASPNGTVERMVVFDPGAD